MRKCWRYLNKKMYTVKELSEKLRRDGFDEEVIERAIHTLQEKGYLNDSEYVRIYLESQNRRPKGYLAVSESLRKKGITFSCLASLREEFYPLEAEIENALKILQMEKERGNNLEKMKRKLIRRGFTWEAIERALSKMEDSSFA
ncbi:MAG: regulatory protein RecX [Candidatus Caldatribacteriaceae bacterium]